MRPSFRKMTAIGVDFEPADTPFDPPPTDPCPALPAGARLHVGSVILR